MIGKSAGYLRARHYSPVLRRFLQRDPILFEGGINLYSYTGCDFVNRGDWEGTIPWSLITRIITAYKSLTYIRKCLECLSKINSPEMEKCKVYNEKPELCPEDNPVSISIENLRKCYPKECDEGCLSLLNLLTKLSWKGGRF